MHCGITAACTDNGTTVPAMTLANSTLWGESQNTRHIVYNKDAGKNSVEMYMPISAFNSAMGN